MPKKIEEKIYILSPSRAYLAPAKVMGPIVHPMLVTKIVAVNILMNGAELYEYIPKTKDTLKLTLGNINDPNRYAVLNKKNTAETKAIPVEPVTRNGVPNVEKSEHIQEPIPEVGEKVAEPEQTSNVVDEPVTPVAEVVEPEEDVVAKLVFEYNEDGTVNETVINWGDYTKNQRKAIRVRINEHNASLTTK